ncbi:DUF4440 domain-containing protein [Ornithinibacillus sp. 179-J 7C1 HS]|uniref:DUF4440 domain-containing protein n=1 Tax=Ornithinibacillus sp. 179-J 7C1 HS TaxID=3142384 RepID=UPI0039A392F6
MRTFEHTLSNYYDSWNEGFVTKDASKIRSYMSEKFVGIFGYSSIEVPEEYHYNYDIKSILKQYNEKTRKEFEIITSMERKNGENYVVLGLETSFIDGNPHRAQCMYVWGLEEGEWKLLREFIEIEQ